MQNLNKVYESLADFYTDTLETLIDSPEYVSAPRGRLIHELVNFSFMIKDPRQVLYTSETRSTPERYLAGEFQWYFSGSNIVEDILPYSSFWKHIQNADGTANSAYGHLLFKKDNQHGYNQWQWAIKQLTADKDTRQAIMYFGGPDYQFDGNKDFVCTNQGQFLIRDNKLHFIVSMRSNDIIKGTTFDVPFFGALQQNMLILLRSVYPELELGYYYHNAASMHIYEPDFELARKMLNDGIESDDLVIQSPIVNVDGEFVNEDEGVRELIEKHCKGE